MANKVAYLLDELKKWRDQGWIDSEVHDKIASGYPEPSRWDLRLIIRWTLIIGALTLGIGLISLVILIVDSPYFLAFLLSAGALTGFAVGFSLLREKGKNPLPKTGNSLIVVACLLLGADVFVLAKILAPSGDHWTSLVLIISLAYGVIAYVFKNPVVLVLGLLSLGTWFGSESGYVSGWGAYYLGMSYPLRFAVVSPLVVLAGYLHQRFLPGFSPFIKVYYGIGLLYLNLSLWMLSLFGASDDLQIGKAAAHLELALFGLVWLGVSVGSFVLGSRFSSRQFRGFGITFLILNLYTRYYEYFWDPLDKWVFFIVIGALTLGVGIFLERRQREAKKGKTLEE